MSGMQHTIMYYGVKSYLGTEALEYKFLNSTREGVSLLFLG
jgi:hypothetical protein